MRRFHCFIRRHIRITGVIALLMCLLCFAACSAEPSPASETSTPVEQEKTICFPEGQLSPGTDLPKWMFAGENIEIRAFSHPDAPVVRTCSDRLVQVLASAYWEEGWALIHSPEQDSSYGAVGWVLAEDLCEYDPQSGQTVTWPVRLREGAIDLNTGEAAVLRGGGFPDFDVWVSIQSDETALVSCEGGNCWNVALSDVLFPTLVDGELQFAGNVALEE